MPDQNLYGRLFRYREREGRAPLEDYLTEALADLLGRMPSAIVAELLGDMVGLAAWGDAIRDAKVSWTTQTPCAGKIADLVMRIDGRPAVVIESKLWSGIRDHGDGANQLASYGRWLADERDSELPSGLVLLTLGTVAPDDFLDGSGYGVETRSIRTWPWLGRWLRRYARREPAAPWAALAREFVGFLGERGMANETITTADLSAAHLFLPGWTRWEATFTTLWSVTDDVRDGFLAPKASRIEINREGGVLWQWRYCVAPMPDRSWAAFAIRYPDVSEWYAGADLPAGPQLQLILGTDRGDLPVDRVGAPPAGWSVHEAELTAALPLGDLPADDDARLAAMTEWASGRIVEARGMMETMLSNG